MAAAELILQSSGPPPIVVCNTLLEKVLASIIILRAYDDHTATLMTYISLTLSVIMNPLD